MSVYRNHDVGQSSPGHHSGRVGTEQQYTPSHPCPICGGSDRDKRGQGSRCVGFLSGDGRYANCTREEHAGQLTANEKTSPPSYGHKLRGPCKCGTEHAPTEVGTRAKGKVITTYDYVDAAGELLFQAVRHKPKGFSQRRPDGKGGYVGNLNGVSPVLYRLPELNAADPSQVVYVCEGEKDADRLRSLGLVATTNPMGAGKWRDEFSHHVKGRNVVILPHNDDQGREHAQQVARSISPHATLIKIVEVPDVPLKGDVSDYLDMGNTVADLIDLTTKTTAYRPGSVGSVGTPGEEIPKFEGPPRRLTPELLPVPPLSFLMIPEPFRAWLLDIAERGCFPLEYPAAAAMVALGGLVGRKVAIRPKRHDDWLVTPNLWGAAIGPPGIQKSPPVEEALRPLKRLVMDALEQHKEAIKAHNEQLMVFEAKSKAAKGELERLAKKKATDEELREKAAEAAGAKDLAEPKPKRYLVNDSTVEKLGELLAENPNGLLQFRDELVGFFRSMDRQGHESDRGFYLESWNGTGSYTYDRIGRGTVHIPNVCLSIFGTIQPGPLARYLKGAASGEEADGFVPRFQILIYPDAIPEFQNVDRYPDAAAKSRAYEVFKALDTLDPVSKGCTIDKERNIPYLGFSPDAQDVFDQWRTELENRLRSGEDNTLIQCHLSKYRSLLPSLALLFHLVDRSGDAQLGDVSLRAVESAAAWCDFLEVHARRVYQSAMDGDPEAAVHLAERIRRRLPNPFTCRQVAQKGWAGLATVDDVRRAVGILEDRNWVKVVEVPSGPHGGRPSEKVWIHPSLDGDQAEGEVQP